jgi:hypothetical protein
MEEEHALSPAPHELMVRILDVETVEGPVVVTTESDVMKVADPEGICPLLTGVTEREVGTKVVERTSIRVVSDPIFTEQAVSVDSHELTL